MPNPLNVPITPPRVAFLDPRSGTVSREWYLFFLSLFQSQGGSSISLDDVQKGPPPLTIDEINANIDRASANLQPSTESTIEQIAELRKQIEALEVQVRPELGTMAALQQDNVPWLRFDTTPEGYPTGTAATGTLYWDDADGIKTLNLVMEDSGGVVQQIGEETYYRIKADADITNGQVVMFTGTVGASGALKGAPATGLTAFQNEYIMGVATQDIAHNGWGYVTWFGLVRGINTTGGAEAWVDGQILYYNPAVPGGLTKTVPTAPNPKVIVASVVNAASNGSLFVRPTFGSALGSTDSNVQIGTLANGNLLIYNNSTSRWENATLTAGTNVTITNGPGSITINSSNPGGTVTSVGLSAPTGFSVAGSPVTSSGTLALSFAAGYSLPTTTSQSNWDTAYSERQQWDGGSTNLVAATGRTSLGATTVGSNLFTLTNPSAVTFLRVNADNTVSALSASAFRTAIGAGTGDGTVTSVAALTLGTTGTDLSSTVANGTTTPVITLNVPTASATNRGALSSTDWSTFNSKQAALVSGTNIKTVGGVSLLGSGDVGTIGTGYGGTGLSSFTANRVFYASSSSVMAQSANFTFDGTTMATVNDATISGLTVGRGAGSVSTATVVGNGAFITNISGVECTAIGYQSLRLNTQGYNTAIGSLAGATNSTGGITAVGARALQNNTTGVGNVAVGGYDATTSYQAALRSNQTGNYNTAMGNGSLTGVTASNNTGYGFMSGYNLTTGTNGIYIGYFATASSASVGSEIVIGASLTGKGANTAYIGGSSGAYNGANTVTWSVTSDQSIKTNVVDLDDALALILRLRPVEFDYIDSGSHDVGFIAQEYKLVLPDQVRKQDTGLLSIQQNLTPYLVKAIHQLTARVAELEQKLK